ncbi:MAG: hypothetical protein J5J06_18300 [Phycisphaerae bacterium]|nr:hypothetical protein [Phycisphaerae bacterium]
MNAENQILNLVRECLDADGCRCRLLEDLPAVELDVSLESVFCAVRVAVLGESPYSVPHVAVRNALIVPEDARPTMAEAVARANFGLSLGCFQLDMSSGRLLFCVGMPVADGVVGPDQFRGLAHCALDTMNRYNRAFHRLIYGDDLSPAEVIAEVEMAPND